MARALALSACALAGAFAVQVPPSGAAVAWLGDWQDVTVTAHVVAEGNLEEESPGQWRQRIDIETEQIASETRSENAPAGLRLNIYSKSSSGYDHSTESEIDEEGPRKFSGEAPGTHLFRYGERLKFAATLNPPRNFGNPGAFDYAGYLRDQGIVATASTKFANLQILPGLSGNWLDRVLARVHRSILNRVNSLWQPDDAALIAAMIVGERSFIERPVKVNFQRSGTYHMLIVAGLHVGILAAFLLWMLKRSGLSEVAASAFSIVAIVVYAELTKQGIPVWRATLMFAAYLAARLLYRRRAVMNALGAAALILLVANPAALFGASFQMSFLCVSLIAGVGVPILERTVGPYARGLGSLDSLAFDRSLPPKVAQFRIDLRMILRRLEQLVPGRVSTRMADRALGGYAIRHGTADGDLLSSRNFGRDRGQRDGCPAAAPADARGGAGGGAELSVERAGADPRSRGTICDPLYCRGGSLGRRMADCRCPRRHAGTFDDDLCRLRHFRVVDSDSPSRMAGSRRCRGLVAQHDLHLDRGATPADSCRRPGDDGD